MGFELHGNSFLLENEIFKQFHETAPFQCKKRENMPAISVRSSFHSRKEFQSLSDLSVATAMANIHV